MLIYTGIKSTIASLRTGRTKWAFRIIAIFILVALLEPLLAGKEPLVMMQNGNISFPAFSSGPYLKIISAEGKSEQVRKDNIDWRNFPARFKLFPLIPYDPSTSDMINGNFISPFAIQHSINSEGNPEPLSLRFRHWLGTTKRGADVMSGMIHGTRVSLLVGIGSMIFATCIGFLLGILAGYFGDYSVKIPGGIWIGMLIMMIPALFYSSGSASIISFPSSENSLATLFFHFIISASVFFLILLSPFLLLKIVRRIPFLKKEFFIPFDHLISRLMELFLSLPRLILIITLSAMTKPSTLNIILIIGFTSWTDIARLVRIEMMRLKTSGFAESSAALGFPAARIIWRHMVPNALGAVRVLILFGIGNAILTEAGLSILGIGNAPGVVSWGTLLFESRSDFSAWWLVVFPGIAISSLILSFNILADAWREQKKLKADLNIF